MSLQPINYKQAAQIGAVAIAVGVMPPVGLTAAIGTLALSAIGLGLVEAADTINTAQNTTHKKSYRIVERSFRHPSQEDKAQAIRRLEHFNSYCWLQADAKDGEKIPLKVSGTCHAEVALLFKQMLGSEAEQLSIEESAKIMQTVDVCYMRGIQTLHRFTRKRLKTLQRDMKQMKQQERLYLYILLFLKAGYKEEIERLKKIDPLYSCSKRKEKFDPELSRKDYSHYFKKAVRAASMTKDAIVRGTVKIPGHTLGFQYDATKKEYYIYNSTRNGLHKYNKEKKFFKKLRDQIVHHIERKGKKEKSTSESFLHKEL